MFEISVDYGPESVTVLFKGQLGYAQVEHCLPVMREIKAVTTKRYVADLSQLTAIDSSGLGMLISLRNASMRANGSFHIKGAAGAVAETLRLARIDKLVSD